MKWLVINIEAFSPQGFKKKKALAKDFSVGFEDLPWVVQKFLCVFKKPFIILDESSKIKTNIPMEEKKKSIRTQIIKVLNNFGHRCIMTATVKSKSPLNVIDQYNFLRANYFPESMWELAERWCVMVTIRKGRGRRVAITKKIWEEIRDRLKNAYRLGGEGQLRTSMNSVFREYSIDYAKQEHIMQHKEYTPFINQKELTARIASDTIFIKRSDLFDVTFDKFVKEPIMRPVEISKEAKQIANELIKLGFSDNLTLGRSAALELVLRLQDICNGFEPVSKLLDDGTREITHRSFKENPKIDELIELMEEIDVENNQIAVWSTRKLLLQATAGAFTAAGISYVVYDGDTKESDKAKAEKAFAKREVQVFLANPASCAYGLNCLESCDYGIVLCVDGSVEKYYQMIHRLLRGQLTKHKFLYGIYAKGSIEERQWDSIRVGQELIGAENTKDIFEFV